jgi:hypothetical protein
VMKYTLCLYWGPEVNSPPLDHSTVRKSEW